MNVLEKKSGTNVFDLKEKYQCTTSLWFAYSALMQQSIEFKRNNTISVKIVIGVWWFFAMIVLSSYTANLAAFLTVSTYEMPIQNFEDLSEQKVLEFGTVADTSIYEHIRVKAKNEDSEMRIYRRLYETISNPKNKLNSIQEGLYIQFI